MSRSNIYIYNPFGRMSSVLTYLFVSSTIVHVASSVLTSSVVAFGTRVELNCSINENDSIQWKYTSWNSSKETNIYLGMDIIVSMRSRYKIDKNISGQHNLIIDSVDFDHAGRYECIAVMQQSTISETQLTVLGSNPVCVANISAAQNDRKDQMHLSIWCSITYTGNATPVFNWTKHSVGLLTSIDVNANDSQTSQGPVARMSSSIPYDLHTNDNGITFQCRITFQNLPSNSQGYLFTVYEYTWKYTLYGPKNLSIVRHEDRLNCSADGNPAPSYRWTHIETNISTDGHVLVLNDTFSSNKDHTFQCTAANIFGTENINIMIQGEAKDAGVTEGVPVTAVAIVASLLLLLIIAVIVSCVVCRKRLKDNASDRPDVALNTDISPYDDVVFSSDRTSNYILEENRLPGRSDGGMISDNVAYSEVSKPKARSKGKSRGNPGDNSRPNQTQTQERKNFIGADGTEYAELSGVKPPDHKGEVPRPPAFSRVDVYASIDHNGRAPPPPPRF